MTRKWLTTREHTHTCIICNLHKDLPICNDRKKKKKRLLKLNFPIQDVAQMKATLTTALTKSQNIIRRISEIFI